MHDDDFPTTPADVARLVAEQHPQWADLPVTPVTEFGTDHCLFHLGDDLVARMPRVEWAADQAASDAAWLPVLAPHLPVAVPAPVALGEPDDDATRSPGRSRPGCPERHRRPTTPTRTPSRPTSAASCARCTPSTRPAGR